MRELSGELELSFVIFFLFFLINVCWISEEMFLLFIFVHQSRMLLHSSHIAWGVRTRWSYITVNRSPHTWSCDNRCLLAFLLHLNRWISTIIRRWLHRLYGCRGIASFYFVLVERYCLNLLEALRDLLSLFFFICSSHSTINWLTCHKFYHWVGLVL